MAIATVENFKNPTIDEDRNIRYHPENKNIEKINNKFNEELQQQIEGTLSKGHTYQFSNASTILQTAGIPNLPIELKTVSS